MSANNYAASLSLLLAHEGGFVNNPKDPGGPTNKGITQKVYDRYRTSKGLPLRGVKMIENTEVRDIYKSEYWDTIGGDSIPNGVDYAMFDYSVNSGITQAVKDMQRTINKNANFYGVSGQLKIDGRLGLATCQALAKAGENGGEQLIIDYCDKRLSFMRSLKNWSTFGTGWQRRVEGKNHGADDGDDGVVDFAVKMAKASTMAMPVVVTNIEKPVEAPANAVELTPPAPIGAHANETPAKAFSSQVAVIRTLQGAGAALAAVGVTGQSAMDAANTAKAHINGTVFGQIALFVFLLCMVGGVGLVLYKFVQDRNEKKAS